MAAARRSWHREGDRLAARTLAERVSRRLPDDFRRRTAVPFDRSRREDFRELTVPKRAKTISREPERKKSQIPPT